MKRPKITTLLNEKNIDPILNYEIERAKNYKEDLSAVILTFESEAGISYKELDYLFGKLKNKIHPCHRILHLGVNKLLFILRNIKPEKALSLGKKISSLVDQEMDFLNKSALINIGIAHYYTPESNEVEIFIDSRAMHQAVA